MTLAERVQLERAEEQVRPLRGPRRIVCWCGCGRWTYREPGQGGRDMRWFTDDCWRRAQPRKPKPPRGPDGRYMRAPVTP